MRRFAILLIAIQLCSPAAAVNERDALAAAIAHLVEQPELSRPAWRYVWIQPGTEVTPAAVDYAINAACGATGQIVRSQLIADGLLAINLQAVDPYKTEQLRSDFDTLALADPVFHVTKTLQGDGPATAILAPHLARFVARNVTGGADQRLDVLAASLTESSAPIYEARFLIEQLLDTQYYRFRRIEVGENFGEVLARAGYFFAESKKQGGLRANLVLRSRITGDQRIIVAIPGLVSPIAATITYDTADTTVEPDRQMVRNLLTFNQVADGSEAFLGMRNGLVEFLLVDGEQKIVAAAPSGLAVDHSKPPGHDRTLRPAISCISCHSQADARSLYQPFGNDFVNLPVAGLTPAEAADIQSIYSRSIDTPDDLLGRARRDYAVAAAQLAGPAEGAIESLHQLLARIVYQYRYDLIGPDEMQVELGLPEGVALRDVITLDPALGIDPEVYLAIEGIPLPRKSFEAIRVQLAAQVLDSAAAIQAEQLAAANENDDSQ